MDILFEHPKFRKLRKQGLTYVDMHYHTNYSMDTSTKVGLIAKTARLFGCGVAITDHNSIGGVLELSKRKNLMVVPGIEITTSQLVDVLAYFYNINELKEFYNVNIREHIRPNRGINFNRITWSLNEILDRLQKYNCLVFIPHPFAPYIASAEQFLQKENKNLLKKIHGFEVLNGLMEKYRNQKAIEMTKKLGKAFIGGSDGHTLLQLGKVVNITENTNLEGFLEYVRKKQNIIMGEELKWIYRRLIQLIILKNAFKLRIKEEIKGKYGHH